MVMCRSGDQTGFLACVANMRAAGKPDITDTGTEAASYEVLHLGNNVYSMDSIFFHMLPLPYPEIPLLFASDGRATQIRPGYRRNDAFSSVICDYISEVPCMYS
jgi:hypothetical protein